MVLNPDEFPPLPSQKPRLVRQLKKYSSSTKPLTRKDHANATLNGLPDELLLQILNYLPCHDHRDLPTPTLLSLSLTNRRFHFIVMDILYKVYNSFFGIPYLLLRTLMSNHEVGGLVKTLYIACSEGRQEDRNVYRPSLADRKAIKEGFRALGIPRSKDWATECNEETVEHDKLCTAMLMHTPNLEDLRVYDYDIPYQRPIWLQLIKSVVSGKPWGKAHRFSKLRTIRVVMSVTDLGELWPLFRLSSLRTLELIEVVKRGKSPFKWPVPERSSLIQNLHFTDCFLESPILSIIIGSCRQLKCFEYEHYDYRWYYDEDGPSAWINYPTVINALHHHISSLEHLQFEETFGDEQLARGALDRLRDFTKVTHLQAPMRPLFLASEDCCASIREILPPSLTSLHLKICGDIDTVEQCSPVLEQMATYLREHLLRLQTLNISISATTNKFHYDWTRFSERLSKLDINVIIDRPSWLVEGYASDDSDHSDDSGTSGEADTE